MGRDAPARTIQEGDGKMILWEMFALAVLIGFIVGFLVGGFMQWNDHQPILRKNRRELMDAYKEQDQLRQIIYSLDNSFTIRQAKGR